MFCFTIVKIQDLLSPAIPTIKICTIHKRKRGCCFFLTQSIQLKITSRLATEFLLSEAKSSTFFTPTITTGLNPKTSSGLSAHFIVVYLLTCLIDAMRRAASSQTSEMGWSHMWMLWARKCTFSKERQILGMKYIWAQVFCVYINGLSEVSENSAAENSTGLSRGHMTLREKWERDTEGDGKRFRRWVASRAGARILAWLMFLLIPHWTNEWK